MGARSPGATRSGDKQVVQYLVSRTLFELPDNELVGSSRSSSPRVKGYNFPQDEVGLLPFPPKLRLPGTLTVCLFPATEASSWLVL